jgi:hypothetical protein
VSHVIVKLFGKGKPLGRPEGELGRKSGVWDVLMCAESEMLKSKQGEVAYWLVGTATVMLATWQFAVMVTN